MDFSEAVKNEYLEENNEEIEILILGSSQVQRAVNPRFLSRPAVNLANKSQILHDDFQLLKHFSPKLPNLEAVILEITYDKLERDETHTDHLLDPINLKFYNVNTFNRSTSWKDRSLFFSAPGYYSVLIKESILNPSDKKLNKYGFDENRFWGLYETKNYENHLIPDESILVENIKNRENYQRNRKLLEEMIQYCLQKNYKILIYHPPTHWRYNNLRDPELVEKWKKLLQQIKKEHPEIAFYVDDTNPEFEVTDFYDGNHLNPDGAKKATLLLDQVLMDKLFNITDGKIR